MKPIYCALLFILAIQPIRAQTSALKEYSAVDKKALQLPDSLSKSTEQISDYINSSFTNDLDKTRAIFIWIASNIQFDIDNMFALNFYGTKEDKIAKALNSRRGICENYAELFTDLCIRSGVRSYVIEGYTKQNGFVDYVPHAWSASLIDSTWFLFDPTWGSGYVKDRRFFKHINNVYYKTDPSVLIRSHMPFDHLWQFLNYPISNQEFADGRTAQNETKPYFNFIDSIHGFEDQDRTGQLLASAYRIEKNGVNNSLIYNELKYIKMEIENDRQARIFDLYNGAVASYNAAIFDLNEFINFRNKQFTPSVNDAEIQQMIDVADDGFDKATSQLARISEPDVVTRSMIDQLTKAIDGASAQVKGQKEWLTLYFSKGRTGRRSMFYKYTWFGIPIN